MKLIRLVLLYLSLGLCVWSLPWQKAGWWVRGFVIWDHLMILDKWVLKRINQKSLIKYHTGSYGKGKTLEPMTFDLNGNFESHCAMPLPFLQFVFLNKNFKAARLKFFFVPVLKNQESENCRKSCFSRFSKKILDWNLWCKSQSTINSQFFSLAVVLFQVAVTHKSR